MISTLLLLGCGQSPLGLRETPDGEGPVVMIDWDAQPLPEIPYPNDLAARADPTSPTGLRINISELASTDLEREARAKINELTGFGIYSPISVRFEAPLDLDNIVDRQRDDNDLSDDAVYVIDVTPTSPTYGQAAELDFGAGRFPADVDETDRYFPNDPRLTSPSLIYELGDEDLDGDGVLDPGEDLDNDGVLDRPNVWPELPDEERCSALALLQDFDGSSCPERRDQLITWYERETDTLIFRPVVPLREETTYAVVLTNRLVGTDGSPVQSPWAWVNHTRQTAALDPLNDLLPDLGLGVEDVAFAWTFTTDRVTGDLVDLSRGLMRGEGPFSRLQDMYMPKVNAAEQLHEIDALDSDYVLPVATFVNLADALSLLGSDGDYLIFPTYQQMAESLVGGTFDTPYLLKDRDDGGRDDSDEWWKLDAMTGTVSMESRELTFTCVIPKEDGELVQPFDVAIFGHGYGSSRFDFLGFAWALSQAGIATCAIDAPGHGPTLSPDDLADYLPVIEGAGLLPFLEHLEHSRYRDLDNDGIPDSGADQWTSDAFHTRDMVRQQVVDWMEMIRVFQHCGEADMSVGEDKQIGCDWDDDGTPDIGGADARFMLMGGSLGGINTAVAAPLIPEVVATVPVVGGAGLMDVGMRSPLSGVVEALVGRLISPLILGVPDGQGGLDIQQMVISEVNERFLPIAHLDSVPAGGRVVVENLSNGELREGMIPDGSLAMDPADPADPYAAGRFRIAIPADALRGVEKRPIMGMPDEGPQPGETFLSTDNAALGDLLSITVYDASDQEVATIDSWEQDVEFEAVIYPAGSPLVAGSDGLGHTRGSPDLRRLLGVTAQITEPGDPAAYAPHYTEEPFEALGGVPVNVLLMPTAGDPIVSVNTEIALARSAGFIERHAIDPDYGMTVDRWLIERGVVHGLEQFDPYTSSVTGESVLFDPFDYDLGHDGTGAPSEVPLRVVRETSRGVSGLSIPYVDVHGSHGFGFPDPSASFDQNGFALFQAVRYLQTSGHIIADDACLQDGTCSYFRPVDP